MLFKKIQNFHELRRKDKKTLKTTQNPCLLVICDVSRPTHRLRRTAPFSNSALEYTFYNVRTLSSKKVVDFRALANDKSTGVYYLPAKYIHNITKNSHDLVFATLREDATVFKLSEVNIIDLTASLVDMRESAIEELEARFNN